LQGLFAVYSRHCRGTKGGTVSGYLFHILIAVALLIGWIIALICGVLWLCEADSKHLRKTQGRCYYFGSGSSPCGDPACPDCHGALDKWKRFKFKISVSDPPQEGLSILPPENKDKVFTWRVK
jgi:hypothetical protein